MAKQPKRPPTIRDVAAHAGLSKSVVSRVLSGQGSVSERARIQVTAAAQELGYVENLGARMRAQTTDTLGVLIRDPASPFYGALLGAMQTRAYERGIRLFATFGTGSADLAQERSALRALLSLRVDGLLVCSGVLPASDLYPFVELAPTVVVGRPEYDERLSSVFCDDEDGVGHLVDFLRQLGHERIAVILAPARLAPTLHVRGNLMIAALRASGATVIVEESASLDQVGHAVRQAMRKQATAIMAPNDRWALAAMEAAGPGHAVEVTGYDGVGLLSSPLLDITTVRQPIDLIGATAVDLLVDEVLAGRPSRHVALPGTLIRGSSESVHRG